MAAVSFSAKLTSRSGNPSRTLDSFMHVQLKSHEEGVAEAALTLQGAIVRQLSTKGRGRVYGSHRASAPGDSPAPDTGDLRRSAFLNRRGKGDYEVGVDSPYAGYLEVGTENIAPRPFMRPALAKAEKKIRRDMAARMKRKAGTR